MSFPTLTPYVDGWLGPEPEITVVPRPRFPFKDDPTPDVYTRIHERDYRAYPALFVPKIADLTAWTNLLVQSEDFTNASWTKTNLTPSAGTIKTPDGRGLMNKVLETVTNGEHSATQGATVTAAVHELTAFVAAGLAREWVRLAFTDSAATTFSAFFNVASGILGTVAGAGAAAKIVALDGGRFLVALRFTPAAGAGTVKANVATSASSISYAGTTTAGVNLWGAQLVAGFDAPYISTTTAARAISAPNRDKLDPFAYLVKEDDPTIVNSEEAVIRRTFSRIPLQRTLFSTQSITKPTPPLGSTPVNFATVTGAGTYTLIGQQPLFISHAWDTANNRVYGPDVSVTSAVSGSDQRLTYPAPHGLAGTERIAVGGIAAGEGRYLFASGQYSVVDTTKIDLLGWGPFSTSFGPFLVAGKFLRNYTPGIVARVRSKVIGDFFLAGVTVGITTADDIPISPTLISDALFLAAVVATPSGYIFYDAKDLDQWMGSMVYQRDSIYINMSDI